MAGNYQYEDNLQSERLSTRFLTAEDAVAWSAFFKDPEAIEFFPKSFGIDHPNAATDWISKQQERYRTNRYGLQAIVEKSTGKMIGQCGLMLQQVDEEEVIEVGYHIIKKYWGKGFAPEAAKIFIDYAFTHNLTEQVVSIIDINNYRSQRVAEKNKLQQLKKTYWRTLSVYIYGISRFEWGNQP